MKKSILSLTFLFCLTTNFAQDSISVLFVGNSYTYVNDLPTVLVDLSFSMGKTVTVDSKTNGGYTFQNHLEDPLTHTKIKSAPWDFVILQGQSQEPSFPVSQVNSQTLPPAVSLADSVYENRYCSQVMYFMTWGRQNGDAQWDSINTFNKMNLRLRDAYLRISDSAEACVSPVGVAWKYCRDNFPTINLYSADGSHPSAEGSYLAACTFYASLFRESPLGSPFTFGLNTQVAEDLQTCAVMAVLDSLETWHLRPTEELAISDFDFSETTGNVTFDNQSWRSQTFQWNFGDGFTSSDENPFHTYTSNGNFSVELIAINECGSDTIVKQINVSQLGLEESTSIGIQIRNLGEKDFEIVSVNDMTIESVFDMQGRTIYPSIEQKDNKRIIMKFQNETSGFYFLNIKNSEESVSVKIPVF